MMRNEKFESFLKDSRLHELMELNRITDDLFDIISLGENQHSKMLAWLLTPSEGHRQGDAIIKDLLEAASHRALTLGSKNSFFKDWLPGRIRTASFGSAFLVNEFSVSSGHGENKKNGRLDLLVVDPANRILIVIENKFGATGTSRQLTQYTESVRKDFPSKGGLTGYKVGRIFLDVNFDEEDEASDPCPARDWVGLSYGWLRNAEKRAQINQQNTGAAARTIISYVRKQTFEGDAGVEPRTDELAAELALEHHAIAKDFKIMGAATFRDLWLRKSQFDEDLITFFFQNRKTCLGIGANTRAAAIAGGVRKKCPGVDHQFIYGDRTVAYATAPSVGRYKKDQYWPFYLKVNVGEGDEYVLSLVWHKQKFASDKDRELLRKRLTNHFKGFDAKPALVLKRTTNAKDIIEVTSGHLNVLMALLEDEQVN